MPDIELRPRQVGSEGQERNRRLVRLPLAYEALDATSGCGSLTALDAAHREAVGGHEGDGHQVGCRHSSGKATTCAAGGGPTGGERECV
jgi:hypothetical protein